MRTDQVLETYDATYAAEYNDTFLHDSWTKASVEFQLGLLGGHLKVATNWLDVACGTGYMLSQFPTVERAGLDISGDMLAEARRRNLGVTFVQRDYREPFPEWNDRWDLVSCMWWAYCFSDAMSGIQQLVARLADWTSYRGTCFLPLCNPQKFDTHNIRLPYIDARVPGRCMITAISWAWIQENGKRHDNMLSPQVEHMVAMFRQHFDEVEIVEGPLDTIGEGWRVQDVLVARRKKRDRQMGDLYESPAVETPGKLEWLFSTHQGTLAGLIYPSRELGHVRITTDQRASNDAACVTVQKIGYQLEEGQRYRVTFEGRADGERRAVVRVSMGSAPWTGLGLDSEIGLSPEWTTFSLEFVASESHERARAHFDVGASLEPVEFRDLKLSRVP